jgi:hypothetical protein
MKATSGQFLNPPRRAWLISSCVVAALGIATAALCLVTPEPKASPNAGVVLDLPKEVIGFTGQPQPVSPAEKTILPPDTQFAKMLYAKGDHEHISCQIVLSGSDKRSIHRPEACLRGQGWTIKNGGVVPVDLSDGTKLDVMELVINRPVVLGRERREIKTLYLYWFVSKEAVTPYHWERIAKTNVDLLLHNQAHRWAYIIVSAQVTKGFVPDGKDEKETLDMLKRFISEAAPQFQRVDDAGATRPRT